MNRNDCKTNLFQRKGSQNKAFNRKPMFRSLVFSIPALIILICWLLIPSFGSAEKNVKSKKGALRTVVIDPGHGGNDPGCHGPAAAYEKNVALAVSLKLAKLIETYYPDVKVILTRKTDVFVELYRRAQIANENKADLFICIHCNSGPKTAFGAETFVMGLHKSEDNLNVAKRENAVILKEDNYEKKYDGFDPNSPEANIIFSLYQNAFLYQSLFFAERVQHQFKNTAKRHNRGVKQAGFLVLYRTTMPSVLIETGFLTNAEEEKYLKSSAGQAEVAESIMSALQDYKNWIEGTDEKRFTPSDHEKGETDKEAVEIKPAKKQEIIVVPEKGKPENMDIDVNEKPVFRVQIVNSPSRISLTSKRFKGREDVWEYRSDNSWKYTVGQFEKQEDAVKLQAEMKKAGFPDAFVVAFRNNQRISLKEADSAKR